MMATGPKVAWVERWAVNGTVPGPIPAEEAAVSTRATDGKAPLTPYLDAYVPEAGGFAFTLSRHMGAAAGGRIAFRPAVGPGTVPATLVWLCGHRPPPPGLRMLGENGTSVDADDLPSGCRGL
jgi:hypothetical protein